METLILILFTIPAWPLLYMLGCMFFEKPRRK